jgi:hypothetical protein
MQELLLIGATVAVENSAAFNRMQRGSDASRIKNAIGARRLRHLVANVSVSIRVNRRDSRMQFLILAPPDNKLLFAIRTNRHASSFPAHHTPWVLMHIFGCADLANAPANSDKRRITHHAWCANLDTIA